MLSLGGSSLTPPPPSSSNTTLHETLFQSLPFPAKTHQTSLSFLSNRLTHHAFRPILSPFRTNFRVLSSKTQKKGSHARSAVSEEEVEDEIDDEEEEEEDEDGEEDEYIPLRNMKEWYANKPRGFGEGKVYDTSIEDRLVEEIERSKRAQLANVNKLKNSSPGSTPKSSKRVLKQRAPEDVPSGIRVRLVNLPKKRNVQRDLQKAFKGVSGIVDVIPAVSGSKKTREPTCTGFAFVYLKTEEDANRFVKSFSGQSITFGKIQKQVRCEMMNPKSPSSAPKLPPDVNNRAPHVAIPSTTFDRVEKQVASDIMNPRSPTLVRKLPPDGNDCAHHVAISSFGESTVARFDRINYASSDSVDLIAPNDAENEDNEYVPAQLEKVEENLGSLSLSKHGDGDSLGTRTETVAASMPSKHKEKTVEKSFGESTVARFDRINYASSDSVDLIAPNDSENEDNEYVPAQWEKVEENLGSLSLSKHGDGDSLGKRTETVAASMPSKHKEKTVENRKKLKAKRKRTTVPKFKLPGSTNRLRVKEKAVLTGVFSKYAAQATSASKGKP